jgi:hypothetical protein
LGDIAPFLEAVAIATMNKFFKKLRLSLV